MAKPWAKLWWESVLSGSMIKDLEPDERAVFFELMAVACGSVREGYVEIWKDMGYSSDQLSSILNVSKELLDRAVTKCISQNRLELLGGNVIHFVNWEKYQKKSDTPVNVRLHNMKHDEVAHVRVVKRSAK